MILSAGWCLSVFGTLRHQWEAFHKSSCYSIVHCCFFPWFKRGRLLPHCANMGGGGGGGRASEAIHHPVQRLADARVLVADLQRGRQKPQISREAEQCACSPCQLFGSSLSQLCSNSTSRCLTGCSCYEVGQLRQRGGEAARRRWRGNGKRRQCVFARVLRQCAKDLANLCRL